MDSNKRALEQFMHEFAAETAPHPWARHLRIWEGCVMLEVSTFAHQVRLNAIISILAKNAGHASRCIKWLCQKADAYEVPIGLTVSPIANAGTREGRDLSKSQIRAWYLRHGFAVTGGERMSRSPKS